MNSQIVPACIELCELKPDEILPLAGGIVGNGELAGKAESVFFKSETSDILVSLPGRPYSHEHLASRIRTG